MKLSTRFLTFSTALTLALSMAGVESAEAGNRWKGARERSGVSHKEVTRTSPGGHSRSWQKDMSWNRGGGTAERNSTWTGSAGGTASRNDSVARTDSGRERNTTWTDPTGNQATRDAEVVRDPESGTRTKDVTWVGRDGETRTRSTTQQKTEDGRTNTTGISRRDGSTVTWEAEVARDQ
jgi:hypothetical protein